MIVEPTRLGIRDLASEALAGIIARPGRSTLTVLGTVLGIAAFVAVLGLTSTATSQISVRFTTLIATEVRVQPTGTVETAGRTTGPMFPDDAEARVERINGVQSAGISWSVGLDQVPGVAPVSTLPPGTGTAADAESFEIMASSPGYFRAIHAEFAAGRAFDTFHNTHAEPVAVLGEAVARRLGITRLDTSPTVFLAGEPFSVIGILNQAERTPEALLSVITPAGTAEQMWGPPSTANTPQMIIDTEVGAAQQVGDHVSLALRPNATDQYDITVPPDPHTLRDQVNTDLNMLFLTLAAVSLIVGMVGIANTTLVAVLERIGEIGLRRAAGARRRDIALQFLSESAGLGLLGGLVGTSLGVITVVAVAVVQEWTPVIEPVVTLPAPLGGAIIGLLAGLYPAWRASRIEPAEALHR
ncbi:ABC transporter permease [Actinobacteria bacterium YIM 96077]|uniref:ABC transporter permease n=1 Tax=Phytoactinopolyspora halophila TaxID=1981511 RepID=A0A329QPF5_9ACTN|nr:ABC transporter permease [Phytoactinopolyspora halophila]AYY12579.1 ABC transporter permease [Actinobacteria bacterium YIM 96077]RAW12518.1 ABC transporter permease [Phytoactinopolyspora halophila]